MASAEETTVGEAARIACEGRWPAALLALRGRFPDEPAEVLAGALLHETPEPDRMRASASAFLAEEQPPSGTQASWDRARAAVLLALGQAADALPLARSAHAAEPKDPEGLSLLAAAVIPLGGFEEAKSAVERLVAMAPTWPPAFELLAQVRLRAEAWPEAVAAAERATELNRRRPSAWHVLARAAWQAQDYRRSVIAYWAAAQLAPHAEHVRFELATALVGFEHESVRRQVPLGILFVAGSSLALFGACWALFRWFGLSTASASLLSLPPLLIVLPVAMAAFRRHCLRELPPDVRQFAEDQRRQHGLRSGMALAAKRFGWIALLVSYCVAVGVFEYHAAGEQLIGVAVFYVVIAVLAWARGRFTKPDEHFSLRDR